MKPTFKLRIALVVVVSLAVGVMLGWMIAHVTQRRQTEKGEASQKQQDFLRAYSLLRTTLADEADLNKLGFFKSIMLDRPPKTIIKIIKQVSDAADKTLEQFDRYRELSPKIGNIPKEGGFFDDFEDALKKDSSSSLLERSPNFSKRLLLFQAQALQTLFVLTKEIEKIDPNKERKAWLLGVSGDFAKMYDVYLQNLRFVPFIQGE